MADEGTQLSPVLKENSVLSRGRRRPPQNVIVAVLLVMGLLSAIAGSSVLVARARHEAFLTGPTVAIQEMPGGSIAPAPPPPPRPEKRISASDLDDEALTEDSQDD